METGEGSSHTNDTAHTSLRCSARAGGVCRGGGATRLPPYRPSAVAAEPAAAITAAITAAAVAPPSAAAAQHGHVRALLPAQAPAPASPRWPPVGFGVVAATSSSAQPPLSPP